MIIPSLTDSLRRGQTLQLAEHDPVGAAACALSDGEPDGAIVLAEGGILEGIDGFEAVFSFPVHAVTRNFDVEYVATNAMAVGDAGGFLPAEVIDAVELVEGGLGVAAFGDNGARLASGSRSCHPC